MRRASLSCRWFLAALLLAAPGAFPLAQSVPHSFPSRPVRLIVGTNPGGGIDVVARLLASRLQDQFGGPVLVENRPGASGTLAAEQVRGAEPDGHTLLVAFSGQMVMNPVLQANISFDPVRDFEPVSMIGLSVVVLVVNPALPVHSVRELVGYARANPGRLNYASGSAGFFFVTELFKQMTGTDIREIPFTGSANAVGAVLAGSVDMAFVDIPPAIGQIRSGRLRALGVTTAQRAASLPDVPVVADAVPGYEFVLWIGMFAPAGTPKLVVDRVQQEIVRAVAAPEMQEKLLAVGVLPAAGTPRELADTLRKDLALVRKMAQLSGPAK